MKKPITKLIKPHKKGCHSVKNVIEGTWESPWFFKEFYYFRRWHRVGRLVCNSTDCKAEMRIDITPIENQFKDWGTTS